MMLSLKNTENTALVKLNEIESSIIYLYVAWYLLLLTLVGVIVP